MPTKRNGFNPKFGELKLGHYGVIGADPAWKFKAGHSNRSTENHYKTMKLADIMALPVQELAAEDCVLLLWSSPPFLEQSIRVMEAWGFRFVSIAFVWLKLKKRHSAPSFFMEKDMFMGLGHTTRKCCEFVLLGKRGRPKRISKSVRDLIIEPIREHSRKPEQFYERTTKLYPGPYLELFSRTQREGWTVYGDETAKFTRPESAAIPAPDRNHPEPGPPTPLEEAINGKVHG